MVKTKTEKRVQYVDVAIEKECRCDRCGKHLWTQGDGSHKGPYVYADYYSVNIGHHDWGRDSVDSIEHFEFCERCAKKAFEEYIEDSWNKSNTLYFDCEHERMIDDRNVETEEEE